MKRVVPRLQGPARDVARGELIGLPVRVARSTDGTLVGREGVVVDESLRTFVVRWPDGRESRLGKPGTTFAFHVRGAWVEVPGDAIEFRPEDRTKKVR
ncbi:MAG TPA: ribonuclease P protein subunit [Candidatus Thermoplasmatota archaeon]|nr:ribonuclease P protein subunit [Candidatus Thermoplasmatota archaeon]